MDDQGKERIGGSQYSTHGKEDNQHSGDDEEEIKGNLLGQLGSSQISFEKNEASDPEDDEEAARFGHDDVQYERSQSFFKTAQNKELFA